MRSQIESHSLEIGLGNISKNVGANTKITEITIIIYMTTLMVGISEHQTICSHFSTSLDLSFKHACTNFPSFLKTSISLLIIS